MQIFLPLKMCLILYDYQSKANRYRKWVTYLKNKITTNQKCKIDSQKPARRECKCNTKENQTTKGKMKKQGTKKKYKINGKTKFKMTINTYILQ